MSTSTVEVALFCARKHTTYDQEVSASTRRTDTRLLGEAFMKETVILSEVASLLPGKS